MSRALTLQIIGPKTTSFAQKTASTVKLLSIIEAMDTEWQRFTNDVVLNENHGKIN